MINGPLMKVAGKSPFRRRARRTKNAVPSRRTLTLPAHSIALLDDLRGATPKSRFLEQLLEETAAKAERDAFYARAAAAYTPVVCKETLALNKSLPIHEK